MVPIEDIKASSYNLDIKNPNSETADHGDPDELVSEYKELLSSVAEAQNALKAELAKALKSTVG